MVDLILSGLIFFVYYRFRYDELGFILYTQKMKITTTKKTTKKTRNVEKNILASLQLFVQRKKVDDRSDNDCEIREK